MDLRKLKTLIDLVAESGIAELEVTEGEDKVRIVKTPSMGTMAAGPVTYALTPGGLGRAYTSGLSGQTPRPEEARGVGLEPTTTRLTAEHSAIELPPTGVLGLQALRRVIGRTGVRNSSDHSLHF